MEVEIKLSPLGMNLAQQNENAAQKWLNSEDFLLYAASPYPPVFDPRDINYAATSANYAWELNLPLPNFAKIIIWGGHNTNTLGWKSFFRLCDGEIIEFADELDGYKLYEKYYNALLEWNAKNTAQNETSIESNSKNTNKNFCIICVRKLLPPSPNSDKFYALLPRGANICFVADPILELKAALTKQRGMRSSQLRLNDDIEKEFANFGCFGDAAGGFQEKPNLEWIENWTINARYWAFHNGEIGDKIGHFELPHFMDIGELSSSSAFDSFCKLAKKFDFTPPSENLKDIFSQEPSRFLGLLPMLLKVDSIDCEKSAFCACIGLDGADSIESKSKKSSKKDSNKSSKNSEASDNRTKAQNAGLLEKELDFGLYECENLPPRVVLGLIITTEFFWQKSFNNQKDLSCEFLSKEQQSEFCALRILAWDTKCIEALKEDGALFLATKEKISQILKALNAAQNDINKRASIIDEQKIIDKFQLNRQLATHFSAILSQHIKYVSAAKPEIVSSWKWYNKFLDLWK